MADEFWDRLGAELDQKHGEGRWHCDDIWAAAPIGCPVRAFLDHARAPAAEKVEDAPPLYATFQGQRVRVVMASRFGDVGITANLRATHGYFKRVHLPDLDDLSDVP